MMKIVTDIFQAYSALRSGESKLPHVWKAVAPLLDIVA